MLAFPLASIAVRVVGFRPLREDVFAFRDSDYVNQSKGMGVEMGNRSCEVIPPAEYRLEEYSAGILLVMLCFCGDGSCRDRFGKIGLEALEKLTL